MLSAALVASVACQAAVFAAMGAIFAAIFVAPCVLVSAAAKCTCTCFTAAFRLRMRAHKVREQPVCESPKFGFGCVSELYFGTRSFRRQGWVNARDAFLMCGWYEAKAQRLLFAAAHCGLGAVLGRDEAVC